MSAHKGCEACKFCFRQDSGYSNWTVEYTSIDCLLNLNPKMPSEDSYIEDPKLDPILGFGETCPKWAEGTPASFDVDGEVTAEDYKDDPEVYALLKKARF